MHEALDRHLPQHEDRGKSDEQGVDCGREPVTRLAGADEQHNAEGQNGIAGQVEGVGEVWRNGGCLGREECPEPDDVAYQERGLAQGEHRPRLDSARRVEPERHTTSATTASAEMSR